MLRLLKRLYRQTLERKKALYFSELKSRGLRIGENVSFAGDVFLDPSHCYLISIGNNVTFAPNVRLIAHDASTKRALGYTRFEQIVIGDNCFIGDSVIILPGVTVGADSIVGAGSIVTKSVPSNSIAVGNPARVVCVRSDFLERRKKEAAEKGVFDSSFHAGRLDENKIAQLRTTGASGGGYIE